MQRLNVKGQRSGAIGDATLPAAPGCFPPDSSVNDNYELPAASITFTDLAFGMGLDEDTLLQRFAAVLSRRGAVTINSPAPDEEGG